MKFLKFFLMPLILLFQNIYCMELNQTQKALVENLNKYLSEQNYLELTNTLYTQLDNNGSMIADQWVTDNTYKTGSVHLMYFRIRQLNKIALSKDLLFIKEKFKKTLELILISLIRTQQDIDCCLSLDLPNQTKDAAKYTYQILLMKYWHLWGEIIKAGLEDKFFLPDFKKILNEAKKYFIPNNNPPKLPSPAWVTCCSFKHWTTWGIYFGSPSELEKQAFNNIDFSKIRYESAKKTFAEFEKLDSWAKFFLSQDQTLGKYIK